MKFPKDKPYRSKKHLDKIRSLDCVECEWPAELGHIEAHHVLTGGMSTKCGDDLTVPLCNINARGCHEIADKTPEFVEKYLPIAKELFNKLSRR